MNKYLFPMSVCSRYWLKMDKSSVSLQKRRGEKSVMSWVAFVQLYTSVIGWNQRQSILPSDAIGPAEHIPRPPQLT